MEQLQLDLFKPQKLEIENIQVWQVIDYRDWGANYGYYRTEEEAREVARIETTKYCQPVVQKVWLKQIKNY